MELVRRNRICAPEGARWACGQRAFIAMRGLLEGKSISCSFLASAGSPKAVCRVGDTDPHPLTVVAADLKAIGAPAEVARIDGDASVMSPLNAAGMAIK